MKIAFFADLHLNTTVYGGPDKQGLTFRTRDFMKAFAWAVEEVLARQQPDCLFLLGDIYDNSHPSNVVRRFLMSQLRRLSDGGLPTHILVGNHDACKYNHALEPVVGVALPKVRVHDEPCHFRLADGTLCLCMPHTQSVERQETSMRDLLLHWISIWRQEINQAKQEGKAVFFNGHFGVGGARMSDAAFNRDPSSVQRGDLEALGADYVLLGDYHGHQCLRSEKSRMFYVGSLERSSFGDLQSAKGFLLFDSQAPATPDLGQLRFIPYPHGRRFIRLAGSGEEIRQAIEESDGGRFDRAVVKLQFAGSRAAHVRWVSEMPALKKRVEERAQLVLHESQIVEPAVAPDRTPLSGSGESLPNSDDLLAWIRQELESRPLSPEERTATLRLASDVMGTVEKRVA